jgi:glycosyltransferase involved in cell wall biosynthesis
MTIAALEAREQARQDAVAPANRPLSIGIVSHNAYGAISGDQRGHVGGVEWQTSLTARWLAARGHQVTMLTWDEGQGGDVEIDGVRVRSICRRAAGLPGVRFFHPRWTGLRRGLAAADADVYYHNCAEYVTGQVAMWCRHHGRAFVYSVASDPDCDPRLPELRSLRERGFYRYGLKHADEVVVQTRAQQQMLAAGFGRSSVVIPMPCPGPRDGEHVEPIPPALRQPRVAWVGRVVELKRLEWLLDLAGQMPDVAFDVVGDQEADTPYTRGLKVRAAALPNVVMHGRLARDRVPQVYRQASCLCCTSRFEGFPNTFLEAFSHGVPVVSTVDPDGLITSRGLGAIADSVPSLRTALRDLLTSPMRWQAASASARQYYVAHHTPEIVLPQFEAIFQRAAARARSLGGKTT